MFGNATVSSRSSSSRSGNSCSRNSSMPSLRMRNPLSPKTSYNPLFRHSDALTSFDASHFVFQEHQPDRKRNARRNPILRRYNSHDSHANFDLRVEPEDHAVSSSETGKSRLTAASNTTTSSESTEEKRRHEYEARDFLERYSLPRVVRVADGEPLLLYRCFDSFTKVQARGVLGKKGKERVDENILHFPEGYSGWFSLTNEKGEKSAVSHTSILQLVREQVCSFISMQPFTAYAAQPTDLTDGNGKVQYLKTQVRGGQLFQLRAVFQHKERPDGNGKHSTRSSRISSRSTRDKDLTNRYAQLVSQTNQELYVQLTTKGEFYEIHSSMKARLCFPGMLDKTGPLALDKDCLYKITHLLRRVALPLRVKLLAGPLPPGLPKDFTDTFILERKFQEPLMVTCTLPAPSAETRHEISCININSDLKIAKCTLGFDSENRLFKSQRLQSALAFCHKNVESWYREVRLAPNLKHEYLVQKTSSNTNTNSSESSNLSCSDCKKIGGHCEEHHVEEEDQNEINGKQQIITKEAMEKFPKSKKWYKHFKILGGNQETTPEKYADLKDPMDGIEKGKSIDRYKDMSKLIEDKFGKKSYNPVKKSASFMFSTKRIDLEETPNKSNPALLKCQSLDTQLYSEQPHHQPQQRRNSRSNISDNLSYDFQMCILDNEVSIIDKPEKHTKLHKVDVQSLNDLSRKSVHLTEINFDEITPAKKPEDVPKLRKSKPDLIPTLPKDEPHDTSYITKRLYSEFHVKTKVHQKPTKVDIKSDNHTKSVIVQVHEAAPITKTKKPHKSLVNIEEIPYGRVADEVRTKPSGRRPSDENIYAEICENAPCTCDTKLCKCKRTKSHAEYCYVKLGSNGDSVTQSDSDEAIYNTLR